MSIEVEHISKTFSKVRALNEVSLSVQTGKLVALVGPSGSGKTTLLRILAGLEKPDHGSGALRFHGEDISHLNPKERGVGMVFQHYALFRHMNIADNIAFGLKMKKRKERPSAASIRQTVEKLLNRIQLEGYENRLPHQLSGGQRQRVALARALAVEPRILLLDEPFGALDAKVRKDLRRWLRTFHEEIQLTTVFVTHDQEEALELADEVIVMKNAQIEQTGSPQDVFDHPISPFVIEFMGNVNRITSGSNRMPSNKDALYIRPHDIEIKEHQLGHDLEAKILHVFSAGSVARVTLERQPTKELLEAEIPRHEMDSLNLYNGKKVYVSFRHIRVFAKDKSGKNELIETQAQVV
jgi:sulfate transport system ATP-binding protein